MPRMLPYCQQDAGCHLRLACSFSVKTTKAGQVGYLGWTPGIRSDAKLDRQVVTESRRDGFVKPGVGLHTLAVSGRAP